MKKTQGDLVRKFRLLKRAPWAALLGAGIGAYVPSTTNTLAHPSDGPSLAKLLGSYLPIAPSYLFAIAGLLFSATTVYGWARATYGRTKAFAFVVCLEGPMAFVDNNMIGCFALGLIIAINVLEAGSATAERSLPEQDSLASVLRTSRHHLRGAHRRGRWGKATRLLPTREVQDLCLGTHASSAAVDQLPAIAAAAIQTSPSPARATNTSWLAAAASARSANIPLDLHGARPRTPPDTDTESSPLAIAPQTDPADCEDSTVPEVRLPEVEPGELSDGDGVGRKKSDEELLRIVQSHGDDGVSVESLRKCGVGHKRAKALLEKLEETGGVGPIGSGPGGRRAVYNLQEAAA